MLIGIIAAFVLFLVAITTTQKNTERASEIEFSTYGLHNHHRLERCAWPFCDRCYYQQFYDSVTKMTRFAYGVIDGSFENFLLTF